MCLCICARVFLCAFCVLAPRIQAASGRCRSVLTVDGERRKEPLSLARWPRHRLFPSDPAEGPAAGDAAHLLVQDGRRVGGESAQGAGGDGADWTVWLRLPPLAAGRRSVRVRALR